MPIFQREPESSHLRCVIVGAGVSGILMAYKLQKHLSQYVSFDILEKNPDLGGTWYENRYPGCACDVPSHCYQFSFCPNPDWSQFYATSDEIQCYLKRVAQEFNLERYITYNRKVTKATWNEGLGIWTIEVEGQQSIDCEIFINASGILNNLQMPDIAGLSSFSGPILHTANWDNSVSLTGKRVAIIGAGASAVQLLPQLQKTCEHIDIYIRTPSWITSPVALPSSQETNYSYTSEEKEQFRRDGILYLRTRKGLEDQFNGMFKAFFKMSPEQEDIRRKMEARMKQLIQDEELQKKLIPTFEVGCRRINPGEQYLTALQEPNVTPIFEGIERIVANGISVCGETRLADVIVAATGFNTTFRPRFPIIGQNNQNLQDLWSSEPISYMGTGVSGFPNYLIFLGPNTPISNGSLMGPLEATSDYFIRILRKMIRENIKSFDVYPEVQQDFDDHTQKFMQNMVWTGTCRSWFKQGVNGRVSALWPGSGLHYMQILAENKWEHYKWIYKGNRFSNWKDGISWIEDPSIDPLGLEEMEARYAFTIPKASSDLSFYLWDSPPLRQGVSPRPQLNTNGTHISPKGAVFEDHSTLKTRVVVPL